MLFYYYHIALALCWRLSLCLHTNRTGCGRHIAFGADPVGVDVSVGVRIRVASCLHSIFWTNQWILTKLAQTRLGRGIEVIIFGDLDLNCKVTPVLWMSNFDQKQLVYPLDSWTKWWILAKLYVLFHWDS